ncbi:P2Y purinoceptor 3 isoform X1 [Electrophorus electricus]|uniref:G-protein coupled receptors family 1 profile domain-containing protein n=1 Tax=Electrophorus electricus TaxID=8005 RepID=A0A4W4GDH6_ELEEL|nr:P2Y purinoceptor 3 isoform X1 [Electrophorus electricus]
MAGALVEQDRSSNSSSNHTASTLMGPLSCSNDESYKYIVLPLCYSVTFLLSVVLNSTVILRSYRSARRWNASLIYMVNLASTDLMYSMSLPLLVASYVMRDHWVFGDFMCRLVRFLFYFNLYCSIFFLTCISVHRYMGICHPMRTIVLESKRAVKSTCAMVWVVVFLLTCPIFRFAQTGKVMSVVENGAAEYGGANLGSTERLDRAEPETYTNCYDVATDSEFSEYVPYGVVLHLLGFFVPFTVIGWCYSQVVRTIFQTLHAQEYAQEGGDADAGPGGRRHATSISISGAQYAPYISRRRKSIKTIVTITFLFALCFLPFHITRTLYLILKQANAECQTMHAISICYKITRPLASFNSWLNALLYFLTGDNGIHCCGWTESSNPAHLAWPLRILGGVKRAEGREHGKDCTNHNHENDSKSSVITQATVNGTEPCAWWISYELSVSEFE